MLRRAVMAQVKMSLTHGTLVLLMVIGYANAICDGCNEMTEMCLGSGDSRFCGCRPSLFRVEGECINTNSYSTEVDLVEGAYGVEEWTDELADEESAGFLDLSRSVCAAFEGVLSSNNTYQDDYYGCEIVAFFNGSVGAIVLSFYKNITDITRLELQTILEENLPETFETSTLTTEDANECELSLDDCDPYLGTCTDEGAGGYNCRCSDASEDISPVELTGRNCTLTDPHWNIVGISAGASLGFFILLLVITVRMAKFAVTGSAISTSEKGKQESEKQNSETAKMSDKTDERPLHPQGNEKEGGGGTANDAFETTAGDVTPENIFDIDEEQMAKLAHIHSIFENHHNWPASLLVPNAQTRNQVPLERVPSVDYGPDHRPSSPVYQNSRQNQKYVKPNLVRLPSGEYLEPMAINQRPPPRQNSSRKPSRPTSFNYAGDDPSSSGIYATRFPSYVERTPTSPTPSEPHLSHQSSSVFLPSPPRHSRNVSSTSTVYYNK